MRMGELSSLDFNENGGAVFPSMLGFVKPLL